MNVLRNYLVNSAFSKSILNGDSHQNPFENQFYFGFFSWSIVSKQAWSAKFFGVLKKSFYILYYIYNLFCFSIFFIYNLFYLPFLKEIAWKKIPKFKCDRRVRSLHSFLITYHYDKTRTTDKNIWMLLVYSNTRVRHFVVIL